MADIKVGDVVELKSGGPQMTVVDVTGALLSLIWWNADRSQYNETDLFAALVRFVK